MKRLRSERNGERTVYTGKALSEIMMRIRNILSINTLRILRELREVGFMEFFYLCA
jgi:hypothetical protein